MTRAPARRLHVKSLCMAFRKVNTTSVSRAAEPGRVAALPGEAIPRAKRSIGGAGITDGAQLEPHKRT
jgi:hypothetical protein